MKFTLSLSTILAALIGMGTFGYQNDLGYVPKKTLAPYLEWITCEKCVQVCMRSGGSSIKWCKENSCTAECPHHG